MLTRKRRRQADKAAPDLTPMIDVTFQLLIFFILCTRFKVDERNHHVRLPDTEGIDTQHSLPKEQVTIYCLWDDDARANSYVVAIDARRRKPVPGSFATLADLVILPSDRTHDIRAKKALYSQLFSNLVDVVEQYIASSGGDQIEKLEISFAVNAKQGAASGSAPWMFVSLAVDAAARVNTRRMDRGQPALTVTFKFTDALRRYAR